QTHHMLCPCHQSTFDVTDGARVIFGPAKRPLPQLPITVDEEGYLVAAADFPEPIAPSFWDIHKDQCSPDHRDSRFPEPGPGPGTRHETRRDRWRLARPARDRKSTRLNSSHVSNSYAVFCLKKKIRTALPIHPFLHENVLLTTSEHIILHN